jgi:hypothetical protein
MRDAVTRMAVALVEEVEKARRRGASFPAPWDSTGGLRLPRSIPPSSPSSSPPRRAAVWTWDGIPQGG